MPKVHVELKERSYDILIQPGLLERSGGIIAGLARRPQVAVVAQRKVWDIWGDRFEASLKAAGLHVTVHRVPNGEKAKTLTWLRRLYGEFAQHKVDRHSLVVAFGGGVVGDLGGYAAASWLRGIDFVQVPTTLLSQVDASVGGKVAVNMPFGKNLVGAFWQPRAVLIDTSTLRTLPRRELLSGLSEVIKYGVILDSEFFSYMEAHRDEMLALEPEHIGRAIGRSCELKAMVVTQDERESGLRAVLNYGHTIGHAIEAASSYGRIMHGEAVAIGMVLAARLAVGLGWLTQPECERIRKILIDYGLPTEVPAGLDLKTMIQAVSLDKKALAGKARFILPRSIGKVELTSDVTTGMVEQVILESQENAASN